MAEGLISDVFERRLRGFMLLRLDMADFLAPHLLERFKREEQELAASMRALLQLRDEEHAAFRTQLEGERARVRRLEAALAQQGGAPPARPVLAVRFEVAEEEEPATNTPTTGRRGRGGPKGAPGSAARRARNALFTACAETGGPGKGLCFFNFAGSKTQVPQPAW